jgi:quinol monooxygenase YgiN
MVYVIAKIKLENFDNWKSVFDERATTRNKAGSKEAILFRNLDDSKEAQILFEWDNKENARKYMESETIKKVLQNAGAKLTDTIYLEKIEKTT